MTQQALTCLHRRWWIVAPSFGLTLGIAYFLLRVIWSPVNAQRWLLVAGLTLAFELWLLYRNLKHNHRHHETMLLPALGAGNILTLTRGLLLTWLAGFLLSPWPPGGLAWLPALLYTLAAVADGFDGYLARRTNYATKLGEILDIEFDALGILIATALAVNYGQLPWWYLTLGLARYLFVFGSWWRTQRGKPVYDLPFSATRRLLAGFQMGFTSAMLWPIIYPPGTILAGIVFAIPFLTGFTRDWLIVSGRINPTSPRYLAIRHRLGVILTHWLPVGLRIIVVLTVINLISSTTTPVAQFVWVAIPHPNLLALFILGLALITTPLVLLGIAGRLAALALLIVASANTLTIGLAPNNGLMLSLTISLMLLGTGAFSLWKPEDKFLNHQAGAN